MAPTKSPSVTVEALDVAEVSLRRCEDALAETGEVVAAALEVVGVVQHARALQEQLTEAHVALEAENATLPEGNAALVVNGQDERARQGEELARHQAEVRELAALRESLRAEALLWEERRTAEEARTQELLTEREKLRARWAAVIEA